MKIVVIGGTGLIGSKTVPILRQGGHEVVTASPNSGVNTITGQASNGAQVVIDLANSPSFEAFSRRRPQPVCATMWHSPSVAPGDLEELQHRLVRCRQPPRRPRRRTINRKGLR